jgi:hypothetical protein
MKKSCTSNTRCLNNYFLLFPEDDDFTVLFWSASSNRPCVFHDFLDTYDTL